MSLYESEFEEITKFVKIYPSQVLGRGQKTIVYKGYHSEERCDVAVKFIPNTESHAQSLIDRQVFTMKKAYRGSHLAHHFLKVYGIQEKINGTYIFMEYCKGGNLKQKAGKISEKQLVRLLSDLLNAIEALHTKNLVHRDLKLQNLLLDNNDILKISDFGLAREISIFMTPAAYSTIYGAPEVTYGKQYDNRCDIWSIGLIIYQLLNGKILFEGANTRGQVLKMSKTISQSIEYPGRDWRFQWGQITKKMLNPDYKRRPNIHQVKQLFQDIEFKITNNLPSLSKFQKKISNNQSVQTQIQLNNQVLAKQLLRKLKNYFIFQLERSNILAQINFSSNLNLYPHIKKLYKYILMALASCIMISKRKEVLTQLENKRILLRERIIKQSNFSSDHLKQFKENLQQFQNLYRSTIENRRNQIFNKHICNQLFDLVKHPQNKAIQKKHQKVFNFIQKAWKNNQFQSQRQYLKLYKQFINIPQIYKCQNQLNNLQYKDVRIYSWIRLGGQLDQIVSEKYYQTQHYPKNERQRINSLSIESLKLFIKPYNQNR